MSESIIETVPFWGTDPNVLFQHFEFFPVKSMTYEQKFNAITRGVIVLGLTSFAFTMSLRILIITFITILAIFIIHHYEEYEGMSGGESATEVVPDINPMTNKLLGQLRQKILIDGTYFTISDDLKSGKATDPLDPNVTIANVKISGKTAVVTFADNTTQEYSLLNDEWIKYKVGQSAPVKKEFTTQNPADIVFDDIGITRTGAFGEPNSSNPFGNFLVSDHVNNPYKKPAPPAFNNNRILKEAKTLVGELNPGQPDIADKLFKDLGEQYVFEQSLRQFTSNPSTTLMNDQTGFADFCYGSMTSCKEGNLFACARNLPRHVS